MAAALRSGASTPGAIVFVWGVWAVMLLIALACIGIYGRNIPLAEKKWVDLAYREVNGKSNGTIDQYIDLLQEITLDLPRKRYSLRNFI